MPTPHSLSLREVTQRLKMLGIDRCAPYADKTSYFVGTDRARAVFPMISGPLCFIAKSLSDDDMLPADQVRNILKRCGMNEAMQGEFWAAVSHEPSTSTTDVEAIAANAALKKSEDN